MSFLKNALYSAALLSAAVMGTTAAHATPFGNATASIGGLYAPTVTGSSIDLSTGNPSLFSGTGALNPPGSASVTVSGAFSYSQTIGATVANGLANFMTFADGSGHTDIFALSSVETTAYASNSGSTAIGLYLLGTLSDPGAGLDPTATSLTMTLNNTNGGSFTFSATLSDPPSTPVIPPVPEPATLLVLGVGVAGLGFVQRRRKA